MPELPEVETTINGIKPHLKDNTVQDIIIRKPKLRWPIPIDIQSKTQNRKVENIIRRGKYIIMQFANGSIIMHLGMSGRVKILETNTPPEKHDHVDIIFQDAKILRYTDPRRFGCILWDNGNGLNNKLIKSLGVEPLSDEFNGEYLFKKSRNRSLPIKSFIMDSKVVVGVGNIYATESLFTSKINPQKPSKLVTHTQMDLLASEIKKTLQAAIEQGGTTLKDFLGSDGKPGYFVQKLKAYGRSGKECIICSNILEALSIGQRTTTFCPTCQT